MSRTNTALRRQLVAPSGPVGRDLTRRAIRVTNVAKTLCPVDNNRLRPTITHTEPVRIREGLMVQIGTNVEYSLAVHEGSGSPYAPRSWKISHARGHVIPRRPYLVNALPAGRG